MTKKVEIEKGTFKIFYVWTDKLLMLLGTVCMFYW